MDVLLVIFGLAAVTVFVWVIDDHLRLRKRVADVERSLGSTKRDRVAELLDDDQ